MRQLGEPRKRSRVGLKVAVAVAVALLLLVSLRRGGEPEVTVDSDFPGIGPRTMITAVAREPSRGVARIEVALEQGGERRVLETEEFETRPAWAFWGDRRAEVELALPVGTDVIDGLSEAPATIAVSAWRAGTWLRSAEPTVATLDLPVRLTPPRVAVTSNQHYPTQGGAEVVVYRLSDGVARHGVTAGDRFFPGFRLPGGTAGEHFALFAVPHDLPLDAAIRVVAIDDVGNRTERRFVDRLRPREIRRDSIAVSDDFIERIAPEIEAETPSLKGAGTLLERYLAINRELRVEDRRRIGALAQGSREAFLWSGSFLPMPNAQVMARFGDRRTYRYAGEEVDRQDHLGYDLASVRRAEVPAANSGIVVAADFIGIYGNVVVIDHGYGLMTLYGHLSSLDVAVGQPVEKGQTIGRSGATGLAGGDHLHFGVFLHGVAVDPVEWLDAGWIENRIAAKLGPALEREAV